MNSRLTCEEIFKKVISYTRKNLPKETNCLKEFLKNDPLNTFANLSPKQQNDIKNAAEKIRTKLLTKPDEKDPQSLNYINIYDALRLFAHFFPRNQPSPENESFVECPLTFMCLNNKSLYYVAADGYWFSLEGLSMLNITDDPSGAMNPWTSEPFLIEDLRRIKLLLSTTQVVSSNPPTLFSKQTLLTPLLLTAGYLAECIAARTASNESSSTRNNIQRVVQCSTLLLISSQLAKYFYDAHKYHQARVVRHNLVGGNLEKELFFDSLPQLRVSDARCGNSFLSGFCGALFGKKNEGEKNISSEEKRSIFGFNMRGG